MQVESAVGELVHVDLDELHEFQGDLKDLSESRYQQLKALILKHKFSFVIHVWENKGKLWILDGHQRKRTMKRMRDKEHYTLPKIPVVKVIAASFKEAKEKVLAGTAQFGEMTGEGLYEFISESGLDWRQVMEDYRFPEIDPGDFAHDFFGEEPEKEEKDISEEDLEDQYILTIHCTDERELQKLFEEMRDRGLECKIVT